MSKVGMWVAVLHIAAIAIAPSITSDQQSLTRETQMRGYWIDPSTHLMWAGRDNGRNSTYRESLKYCQSSRLGGYSGWKLPTIDELQGIYDPKVQAPGLTGPGKGRVFGWHVKGGLFLTGFEWSNNRSSDRGHPYGAEWFFNFDDGQRVMDQTGYAFNKRALCVRDPQGT